MDVSLLDLEVEIQNSSKDSSVNLGRLYKLFSIETDACVKESLLESICNLNQSLNFPDFKIYQQLAEYALERSLYSIAEQFCVRLLLCNPTRWWALNQIRAIQRESNSNTLDSEFSEKKLPVSILRKYFPKVQIKYTQGITCENDGVVRHVAYPSEKTAITAPFKINYAEDKSDSFEFRAYSHTSIISREAYTLEISGGSIWFDGFNFVVWNKSGEILDDVSTGNCEIIQILSSLKKPIDMGESACLLGSRISSNYYHWMYDAYPRISVLEKSNISVAVIKKYIATRIDQRFHRESLEAAGISLDKVHSVENEGEFVRADTLYIPSYGSNENLIREKCSPGDNLHSLQGKWSSEFLRKKFLDNNVASEATSDLKLFITRGKGNSRSFLNEEKFVDLLESKGFTVVEPESLSVRKQAELFSQASVVIAAHGAALTNAVFCKPNTRIVEIHGPFTASCFWFISNYMNLEHITYLNRASKKYVKKLHGQNYYSSLEKYRLTPLELSNEEFEDILNLSLKPKCSTDSGVEPALKKSRNLVDVRAN